MDYKMEVDLDGVRQYEQMFDAPNQGVSIDLGNMRAGHLTIRIAPVPKDKIKADDWAMRSLRSV